MRNCKYICRRCHVVMRHDFCGTCHRTSDHRTAIRYHADVGGLHWTDLYYAALYVEYDWIREPHLYV